MRMPANNERTDDNAKSIMLKFRMYHRIPEAIRGAITHTTNHWVGVCMFGLCVHMWPHEQRLYCSGGVRRDYSLVIIIQKYTKTRLHWTQARCFQFVRAEFKMKLVSHFKYNCRMLVKPFTIVTNSSANKITIDRLN